MASHTVTPTTTELDAYTAQDLALLLSAFAARDDLVVDLAGVTFCDSTGMGALTEGWRRQNAGGGSLAITNVGEPLTRLFGPTNVLDLLTGPTPDADPPAG